MRTLVKFSFPTDTMNEMIEDGSVNEIMDRIFNDLHPEAVYFTTNEDGERGGFMVIDLKDPSDMPRVSEPFFLELGARLTFSPVMNVEDLKKGLASLRGVQATGRG